MLYPDPFRDLAVVYDRLARRPPDWVHHPSLRDHGDIDGIVTAIRDDYPDSTKSDLVVRTLARLGRHDPSASTVLLHALEPELRTRLRRTVTDEFRADALSELTAIILEGDVAGNRLAHRYVNRAHNRIHKHHRRVRHHGRAFQATVNPYPADIVSDISDHRAAPADIGDLVAARIDLERFGTAVTAAIDAGKLSEQVWARYTTHRLHVIYAPDRDRVPARERIAAWRAAKKVQPLINRHLAGHAA